MDLLLRQKERKLGIRSSPTTEIIFQECKVPQENVLGKIGDGFKIAMNVIAMLIGFIALIALLDWVLLRK